MAETDDPDDLIPTERALAEDDRRIMKALDYAVNYACIDGAHHKMWVIDQMVRALTGCPVVEKTGEDARGEPYTYEAQGESDEYREWTGAGDGDFGWDAGIAP